MGHGGVDVMYPLTVETSMACIALSLYYCWGVMFNDYGPRYRTSAPLLLTVSSPLCHGDRIVTTCWLLSIVLVAQDRKVLSFEPAADPAWCRHTNAQQKAADRYYDTTSTTTTVVLFYSRPCEMQLAIQPPP